ncbi:MAG TPA: membrane-bound lytic murein transglycosylase MltF [Alcanivoracaceae bacterium]|nr:membrane-bound lytic murein transglycosylase MltF [Alcanivoracaceae bacterium]
MRFISTLFMCLWLLSACSQPEAPPLAFDLDSIKQEGLVVLTRNAPTTYFINRDGEAAGFEHDSLTDFAASLGVPIQFKIYGTSKAILEALETQQGHIAAAGLIHLNSYEERFEIGPEYYEVEQQVVCHRSGPRPKTVTELADVSLLVSSASSYDERLHELKEEHPNLTWQTALFFAPERLLEKVVEKKLDCTIVDSNIFSINRRYFPDLVDSFSINDAKPLVWLMPKGATELREELEKWYAQARKEARTTLYAARYFSHVDLFDYVDITTFKKRIDSVLPRYEQTFREAGEKYGLDWRLLAAVSYQESHWNPNARSPTGVRGMMMLTNNTARELGVTNRLDPTQSIHGGARYLAQLRDRLPDSITEPDRTWIALAAYNVGLGHVYDARTLTRNMGLNPDSWFDLRAVLPKLSQPRYYRNLRYGYARGGEPVHFIRRIRNYEDILQKQLDQQEAARQRRADENHNIAGIKNPPN